MRSQYFVSVFVLASFFTVTPKLHAVPDFVHSRTFQVAVVTTLATAVWNYRETVKQYWLHMTAVVVAGAIVAYKRVPAEAPTKQTKKVAFDGRHKAVKPPVDDDDDDEFPSPPSDGPKAAPLMRPRQITLDDLLRPYGVRAEPVRVASPLTRVASADDVVMQQQSQRVDSEGPAEFNAAFALIRYSRQQALNRRKFEEQYADQ